MLNLVLIMAMMLFSVCLQTPSIRRANQCNNIISTAGVTRTTNAVTSDHQVSTLASTRKRQYPLNGFSNGIFKTLLFYLNFCITFILYVCYLKILLHDHICLTTSFTNKFGRSFFTYVEPTTNSYNKSFL